jgi:hypothetical protein
MEGCGLLGWGQILVSDLSKLLSGCKVFDWGRGFLRGASLFDESGLELSCNLIR